MLPRTGGPIKRPDIPLGQSMTLNLEREAQERKRRERLAASLRENLKRRKAQQRGRATQDEPAAPDEGAAPVMPDARV